MTKVEIIVILSERSESKDVAGNTLLVFMNNECRLGRHPERQTIQSKGNDRGIGFSH
jgi:hypothetical protein